MLTHLSVKNFSLIDQIEITLENGLTVITGETGAGKSILLGALSLILGERMNHSALKDRNKKCIVEGTFSIEAYDLKHIFESHDLDYEPTAILRREISPQGKSRSFVNDTPTTLEVMKKIGSSLIDVHSQHQSIQINQAQFQLEVMDTLAANKALLLAYQKDFQHYKSLKAQLEEKKQASIKLKKEEDFLKFQLEELQALNLKEDEIEQLEQEQKFYANSEMVIRSLSRAQQLLSSGETNMVDLTSSLQQTFNQLEGYLKAVDQLGERLNRVGIEINDISMEVEQVAEGHQYDPQRHQWLEERLNEAYRLQQKHQLSNADQLVELEDELNQKLNGINSLDQDVQKVEQELDRIRKIIEEKATELSNRRLKAIPKLEKELSRQLQHLGIPHAVFKVDHELKEQLSSTGKDELEFLFSANKGLAPQKIAKTASGGEISRLMLSLKWIIAKRKQMPTLIFDEIDAGVSGEIADQMGETLFQISQKSQLVAITHLPQLAAKGKTHLFVYKEDIQGSSQTKIKALDSDGRVMELAKMLSGKKMSQAAINNAKDLLSF